MMKGTKWEMERTWEIPVLVKKGDGTFANSPVFNERRQRPVNLCSAKKVLANSLRQHEVDPPLRPPLFFATLFCAYL